MVETQINPCTCMFTYPKGIRGFFFFLPLHVCLWVKFFFSFERKRRVKLQYACG